MRLFEHPDFDQAVIRAAEYYVEQGIRPSIIEKDYYVTEVLRQISKAAGDKVIFKGGTSLSKGWNLIQRFSEDIDLFLDPHAFTPPLGKKGVDRELKKLRDVVAAHPALSFLPHESQTIGGFGRRDRFSYLQRFGGAGDVVNKILLEAGSASGREPTTEVEISSYLAAFLSDAKLSLGAEDEAPFKFRLLHFRRTFVEKLFAIHSKVELFKRDGVEIGTYARHYYDLFQLSSREEVLEMLRSDEYGSIKKDYDRISRDNFKNHFCPDGMTFVDSEAFFPPSKLSAVLGIEFERQCAELCYGPYPTWAELLARFEEIRLLL